MSLLELVLILARWSAIVNASISRRDGRPGLDPACRPGAQRQLTSHSPVA